MVIGYTTITLFPTTTTTTTTTTSTRKKEEEKVYDDERGVRTNKRPKFADCC